MFHLSLSPLGSTFSRTLSGKAAILSGSAVPFQASTAPMSRFPWIITTVPQELRILR